MGWPCLCVQRASGQVNGALVTSWEHSVSLFLSSIILLDSPSQFYVFTEAFPAASIQFPRVDFPSILPLSLGATSIFLLLCPLVFFGLIVFLSLPPSVAVSFSSLCLFITVLGRREQTSLKYQKTDQEASLVSPPSTNSPSPFLTDKQKRACRISCLPSLLYPTLPFLLWRGGPFTRPDVCVALSGTSLACRRPLCWKHKKQMI